MWLTAFSFSLAISMAGVTGSNSPVLLTGTLQSQTKQNVVSPMTDNWRVQVQWLKPEGEAVVAGERVAVFDAGSLQSTIERLKTQVDSANEQLNKLTIQHQLTVMEAEYEVERRQLLLEKASIDAAIPLENISHYDYELYQLDHRRAETELEKAKKALVLAQVAQQTELTKQQLQIDQQLEELADTEQQLDAMSVYANFDGAFTYGTHPWYGTKVFSGMTAQPGWLIGQVQPLTDLTIEAWVYEADVAAVQQAESLTARFDIAAEHPFSVRLHSLAQQGEQRRQWGPGLYYRAEFHSSEWPVNNPRLGMGLLLEVQP
ncbi:multidrug transporter [Alkalimonas collagenimarina]|uniref:Multidrug transporter n=1 Tax=Alkalimonas collagenimarina TaxID=400390 RepID=A0ABT9GX91_9GAMM|nr:multidrug transporter [Alkalimonas collagenimarina]MDP4535686.1 multidrug transporter [Alkalimonas collagenimarina]